MRDVGAVKNLYIGEGVMKEAGSNCSEFSLPPRFDPNPREPRNERHEKNLPKSGPLRPTFCGFWAAGQQTNCSPQLQNHYNI